jgi:hypothetical protein
MLLNPLLDEADINISKAAQERWRGWTTRAMHYLA